MDDYMRDLLVMDPRDPHGLFSEDFDITNELDPLGVVSVPLPACDFKIPDSGKIKGKIDPLPRIDSDCDSYDDSEEASTSLSKRQEMVNGMPRKKRLRGEELITSLKRHPIFKDHEELFEANLDDLSRKKLMQKIRNRVSAQESRDRKKVQFGSLQEKNFILEKEKANLRAEVEDLRKENKLLKKKIDELMNKQVPSTTVPSNKTESESTNVEQSNYSSEVDSLLHEDDEPLITRLKRKVSGESRLGWQGFMLIVIAIALCCVTLPEMPTDGNIVKSSAIVPMIGGNLAKPNSKALVRLEGICKDFCDAKLEGHYKAKRREEAIGKYFVNLDNQVTESLWKIVLQDSSSVNLTLPNSDSEGMSVYPIQAVQPSSILSQGGPYSTMVCSAVIDLDKSSNLVRKDDYIHFVYPKEKDTIIGEGLIDDDTDTTGKPDSEYVGILAKVVSKKDFKLYQKGTVIPSAR
jgi:hypothetical protein